MIKYLTNTPTRNIAYHYRRHHFADPVLIASGLEGGTAAQLGLSCRHRP